MNNLKDLTDDEFIINSSDKNDEILKKDYLSSLVDQKERIVYYEIENIYSNEENKRYKNKMQLKKKPPILIVKDDFGNEAIFYLTENLTDELTHTLKEVKRAYYGFDGPIDMNVPDRFVEKMIYYAKNKPLKLILPIIIVILTIVTFFK